MTCGRSFAPRPTKQRSRAFRGRALQLDGAHHLRATRLNAGHANNALPQLAQANVNCRILPGHSAEEIRQKLIAIFADPQVTVRYVDNAVQRGGSAHRIRKHFRRCFPSRRS